MATPVKTAQGTWRIQIEIKGVRDSATFATKREAVDWGQRRTLELRDSRPAGQRTTLLAVFRRYAEEVSPSKRGNNKEAIRLKAFESQPLPLSKPISDVQPSDLSTWRDARLKVNARGSVLRDISLLSSVFETARRDWGLIQVNPMRDVRKPANPDHRDRVIAGWEIRGMLRGLDYRGDSVTSVRQSVTQCFLLALSTGMRAGELCGLQWSDVFATHVHLPMTKNGKSREVPLTPVAQRILARMRGWDDASVFALTPQTLDAMFRKYRDKAGLSGFRFHDSRHSAATRLAKQLHVLELCKVFGWSDPKMAMVYFNPDVTDLAQKLIPKR
jgi:integrase